MSRRKPPPPQKEKAATFENASLRERLGQWKKDAAKDAPAPKAPQPAPSPRPAPPAPARRLDDDALFRIAMEGVAPLRAGSAPSSAQAPDAAPEDDAETVARLAELVAPGERFEFSKQSDAIEGSAEGVSPALLERMRAGDFPVEARIDLSGLSSDGARDRLESSLVENRRLGRRCVLVVHGRTQDEIRSRMSAWLSRGRLPRIVLAFVPARAADGGANASYLLLRR